MGRTNIQQAIIAYLYRSGDAKCKTFVNSSEVDFGLENEKRNLIEHECMSRFDEYPHESNLILSLTCQVVILLFIFLPVLYIKVLFSSWIDRIQDNILSLYWKQIRVANFQRPHPPQSYNDYLWIKLSCTNNRCFHKNSPAALLSRLKINWVYLLV